MKELKQRTMKWLRERFGESLYDDLCDKRSVEEAADYFLENHSVDEIERDGLNVCLESWTEGFVPAKEMEARFNEEQIEMLQANACAWNEGRPPIYSEEEIWEA